jgi:hypothetical protein
MTTQPEAAVEVLRSRGIIEPVEVGISVGPQLGALAENLENAVGVPYADLPGFPVIERSAGEGRLIVGMLEGTRILALLRDRRSDFDGNAARDAGNARRLHAFDRIDRRLGKCRGLPQDERGGLGRSPAA